MKIAFTSCMSPNSYAHQQVWNTIAATEPDVLVLLGDSVYIDCPPQADGAPQPNQHPKDDGYQDNVFASHLHKLYQDQLAVPEFRALLSRPNLQTHAIWDDHDFLWNDADSTVAHSKAHFNQAVISSNLLACWRHALSRRGLEFPQNAAVGEIWKNYKPVPDLSLYDIAMPGYSHVVLNAGVLLHLTDGRSWRTAHHMLGQAQRQHMEAVFKGAPDAVHIVASGSTFGKHGRSGWLDCQEDANWLLSMAEQYRILMISGDIHHNASAKHSKTKEARNLYEVTASGAAVNFNPFHWSHNDPSASWLDFSQKFGVLDIQNDQIDVRLFDHGKTQAPDFSPIAMATW